MPELRHDERLRLNIDFFVNNWSDSRLQLFTKKSSLFSFKRMRQNKFVKYIESVSGNGIIGMNSKQKRTWKAIFENPVRADVKWTDIESLFVALGAVVKEGSGSRVRILIKERVGAFHRPHPSDETGKATLKDVRDLLSNAGVEPPKAE